MLATLIAKPFRHFDLAIGIRIDIMVFRLVPRSRLTIYLFHRSSSPIHSNRQGNPILSKFDEARRNSAAANPNRQPERLWEASTQTVDGSIAGLVGTQLSMKKRDESLVSHTLAKDATYTCDGEACQASDLAIGYRIRVTVAKSDRTVAVGIESLNKHQYFKTLD
jgi:hypothetical protein